MTLKAKPLGALRYASSGAVGFCDADFCGVAAKVGAARRSEKSRKIRRINKGFKDVTRMNLGESHKK